MLIDDSWGGDPLMDMLGEIRDVLNRTKYGFPPQRWRMPDGAGRGGTVTQTSAGHLVGPELLPGTTTRLTTRLTVPERVGRIPLDGDDLDCHVFSRFPFRLVCDGRDIVDCADPPIARGRVFTSVLQGLTPGREHDLELVIDVPENLIAYGFRLTFSTTRLRGRWHAADAAWARLLLAGDGAPENRRRLLAELDRRRNDVLAATVDTLPDILMETAAGLEPTARQTAPPAVHLIGYAHIDVEWLWTWEQTRRAVKAICARAVDLLGKIETLHFSLSQPVVYEVLRQEEPQLMDAVREWVRAGRWEPVTATWVESDLNVPSAESLIRQMTEARRFTERELGERPTVCVAADTFGHPASLPQILAKAGYTAYYHTRCHPVPGQSAPAYRWIGPDGSSVIGVVTDAYDGELLASRVAEEAVRAGRAGLGAGVVFFDIDGHTGEEVVEGLRRLEALAGDPVLPATRCTSLRAYVETVAGRDLPAFSGPTPTVYEGAYTTNVAVKQANRRGEMLLGQAEALCCMAGLDRRTVLAEAWRRLLFWQNHDTLAGTSIVTVYDALARDLPEWERRVEGVIAEAAEGLTAHREGDVAIVNPTPWARREWVRVDGAAAGAATSSAGDRLPVQAGPDGAGFVASVPAWGVMSYRLIAEAPDEPEGPDSERLQWGEEFAAEMFVGEENQKDYFRLRNRYFSLLVRGDAGSVVSLVSRDGGGDFVAYGTTRRTTFANTARPELGLNVLQIVRERPHSMSAWHHHEAYAEESLLHTGRTAWVERGPLRLVLRTTHTIGATVITQDMTVCRDLPRVDVRLTVDWGERGGQNGGVANLKVAFTPDLAGARVHAAVAAGVSEHRGNGQESPMQRWVDVSDGDRGLGVVTEDRYGFDALGARIRVTLVRGAYDPAADSDVGRHVFRYAFIPHRGTWRDAGLPVIAENIGRPLLVVPLTDGGSGTRLETPRPAVPLPALDPDSGALATAVTQAEDGEAVLYRLLDWTGRGTTARLGGVPQGTECRRTTFSGEPLTDVPIRDGCAEVDLDPWAVETVALRPIKRAGSAPARQE